MANDRASPDPQLVRERQARAEVEAALAREYRFQDALGQALRTDVPEQGLAEVLHERLGLAVVVEDSSGRVLARAGDDEGAPYPRVTRAQRDHLLDAALRASGPLRAGERLASVAASRGTVLGVIVVLDPEDILEPSDESDPESGDQPGNPRAGALHAISLTTSALTLHLRHRRILARTELRLRHDLVETVLVECHPDDLEAEVERQVAWASALSHDLTGPHRVLAVRPRPGPWPDGEAVGDLLEHAARTLDMSFLGTLRGQTAVLVCGTPSLWLDGDGSAMAPWSDRAAGRNGSEDGRGRHVRSKAAWRVVHDAFTDVLQGAPAIGVGGFVERPEHLPRSYREAMQALTVSTGQAEPQGLITFEDLGLHRRHATNESRREARAFVEDWLGSLLAYDARRQTGLVHTLGVYLDRGGDYDATAAALHIHRSTLRYRLQRIRELSGHDLANADTRLNLHAAVRAAVVAEPLVLPATE
ncbi:CdaR family transcriptional regulator [Actinomycetospora sp. TBRC 11914]|uniref:PucR family transcriptional regulator n=1 Tax=Actinomycetospora sp. TBRC 11914 TaxID=2729387 RepID=UPI00145E57BB|nr:helix-turn-helix domain-containing protein [Actinomycetospora sp. TBRC 11914]NMO89343.1 PucR family transcriptional regulator [Actinomycetospora sp. TBRC 11914]